MKKKSFFFRAFIASTLLAAIPTIVITVILSYQMMGYSEDEIGRSAIGKLKIAANFSKTIAQNFYIDALKLNVNGTMDNTAGLTAYDRIFTNPDGFTNISRLSNALWNLAKSYDILHSVYLIPDGSDYILSSSQGVMKLSDFYDKGWMAAFNDFKKYKSGSAWLSARKLVTSETDEDIQDNLSYKVITFFYRLTSYTTTVSGTLIFNVHEDALLNLISDNISINEGQIFVINSDGIVIMHNDNTIVGRKLKESYADKIMKSENREGYIIDTSESERQLITFYKSDFNDWIYIGVLPLHILTEKVNALIMRLFSVSLVFLVAGILIAYLVSKRISSPINKLVQDIKERTGINIKSSEGEMAILSNAIDHMLKEEDRLFSILESNRNVSRNAYLTNLLQGKTVKDAAYEIFGLDFMHGRYVCAVAEIDRYGDFKNKYAKEQQEYIAALILTVSEQLIGTAYKCAGVVYEKRKIALVVNFDPCPPDTLYENLGDIFVRIRREMLKVLDNTISVGIGSIQESLYDVGESFEHAQEALKCKLINGAGSTNIWQESTNETAKYYYPYAIEKQIFNIINSGEKDKIEAAIADLITDIRDKADMQYENVIQIFNQFTSNIVKFLLDLHLNISMVFGSNYNIYHELSTKETMEDIRAWLTDVFIAITEHITVARNRNMSYFDRAMDFINKNYKKDIDINMIADSVGISYSHLRKIFKDETGDNIVNYINSMRINESKRLLSQTSMTIREIATNLGYNNEQSFMRFFKKYEGVSPNTFRSSTRYSQGYEPSEAAQNNSGG